MNNIFGFFKGKEKEKPKTETPSIPSTPQMQPPNKQTSPLPTPNTGNNPPRMNKKSDSMSFAPANQGQSNQNMFAGMALKKNKPINQERQLTDPIKEEPRLETIQKPADLLPPMKPQGEKKKFGFIKKEEPQPVERPSESIAEKEEDFVSKAGKNPTEPTDEETKISHEETDYGYNPELIKHQIFKKEDLPIENISNDFGNSSEKNFSHQGEYEKSEKSEKFVKEEAPPEKPKSEKKRAFKFASKEKAEKKERNEHEGLEYQPKSIKDLEDFKDQDSRRDASNNDNVSISHSEKITYTPPIKENFRAVEEKADNAKNKISFIHNQKEKEIKKKEVVKVQELDNAQGIEQVYKTLEEEDNKLKEKLNEIIIQQHSLTNKKNYLDIELENLKKKTQNIENQQNEAISKENFEEADQLEIILKQHHESIHAAEAEIFNSMLHYNELESSKEAVFKDQVLLHQDYMKLLDDLRVSKTKEMSVYQNSESQKLVQEKSFIEEEKERLKINKTHLDLDVKHLNEESQQIEENMDKQTKEYKLEQSSLINKKTELTETIEKIKRELEEKQIELDKCVCSLENTTTKLNNIKSKFDNQIAKLAFKREKMNEELITHDLETRNLEDVVQINQENERYFSKSMDSFKNQMQELEKGREKIDKLTEKLQKEKDNREKVFRKYQESNKKYLDYQLVLKQDNEQMEEFKRQTLSLDKESSEMIAKRNALEQKLPNLENEKQTMVKARNFKGASGLTNEIKETQNQISEINIKINVLKQSEENLHQQIIEIETRKEESNLLLKKYKEEADKDKYYSLLLKQKDLKQLYNFTLQQRQYEECNILENELKLCTKEIVQILNLYPELDDTKEAPKQATEDINKSILSPDLAKENKSEATPINSKKLEGESPVETPILQESPNNNTEKKPEDYQENNHENQENEEKPTEEAEPEKKEEVIPETTVLEEKKEEVLVETEKNIEDLRKDVLRINELRGEIMDLEREMNDLAEEEKFEEAEEKNVKITELQQEEVAMMHKMKEVWGIETFEEALIFVSKN